MGRDGQVQVPKTMGTNVGLFHYACEFENEEALVDRFNTVREIGYDILMTQDHRISHAFYLTDPDGNLLEFYSDMTKDWRRSFHGGEMELITGNWLPGETAPITESCYDPNPALRRVNGAPLQPLRITHIALVVGDLVRAHQFYSDVIGLDTLYKAGDDSFACLCGTLGQHHLSLFQATNSTEVGMHHFGLEVAGASAIGDSVSALRNIGVTVEREFDDETKRSIFIQDCDGTRAEFFVDRKPNYQAISEAPPSLRPFLV